MAADLAAIGVVLMRLDELGEHLDDAFDERFVCVPLGLVDELESETDIEHGR